MEKILEVFWKNILVGNVFRDAESKYIFKYNIDGVDEARKIGFEYIVGFKDINEEYKSENLFPIFTSRIPPKNRHDIDKFLERLELNEYDEVAILKATNAKCYTDDIEVR